MSGRPAESEPPAAVRTRGGPSVPDGSDAAPRRGRGRRPAEQVRADALRAAGGILLAEGLADLTFDRVAQQAGVSRTTLHKWWPSIGALALDGYFHSVEDALVFPDTGDIRADLRRQLDSFVHIMTETPAGRAVLELIGRAQTDRDLADAYRRLYSSGRRALAEERLRRAQELGQVRGDVDPQTVVDQLWGAVYHRLLVPDEPVTRRFVDGLLANLFDGIAARDASDVRPSAPVASSSS